MVSRSGLLTGTSGAPGGGAPALRVPALPERQRRAAALWAMLALCLMAAVRLDGEWAVWAKALADPLFHSTSAGAALALLGLLALSGASLLLCPVPRLHQQRQAAAVLLACIALGNGANLAAHLSLLQAQGLPWQIAVYFWSGESNSYSYLLHAHTGKLALQWLFAWLPAPFAQGYDIGGGLAGASLSPLWGAACLACLAGALLAYLRLLPWVVWRSQGAAMPLLFGFCALNALKTIADGGPLSYRFAPVFAVLLLWLPAALALAPRWHRASAGLALLLLAASAALSLSLAGPQAGEAGHGLFGTLALIAALALWAEQSARSAAKPASASRAKEFVASRSFSVAARLIVSRVFSHVISFCALGTWLSSALPTPLALFLPLPEGMIATRCELASGHCSHRPVAGLRAYDVYLAGGDEPLKPRFTLLAPANQTGNTDWLLAIHPLSTQAPRPRAEHPVSLSPIGPLPGGAGVLMGLRSSPELPAVFAAQADAFSGANVHVLLHLAAAELAAQGLASYTMVPLRHAGDAQALGLALRDTGTLQAANDQTAP